jgi:hypothetical protein
VIGVHMLHDWAWTPALLKAILLLSVMTIIVIGAEWLTTARTRRVPAMPGTDRRVKAGEQPKAGLPRQ